MTPKELKGKYARVRDEIDALSNGAGRSDAKLARLRADLDQVEQELLAFRRLASAAPILQDVVPWAESTRQWVQGVERRVSAR